MNNWGTVGVPDHKKSPVRRDFACLIIIGIENTKVSRNSKRYTKYTAYFFIERLFQVLFVLCSERI